MAAMQRPAPRYLDDDARVLVFGLAAASLVELTILRLFTRTAIHIPALEQLQTPYAWLSGGGRFAYFVAVSLLAPALVLLCRARGRTRLLVAPATVLFLVACGLGLTAMVDRALVDIACVLAVTLLVASGAALRSFIRGAAIGLFGLAFASSATYAIIPDISRVAQPEWLLPVAEAGGLAFAFTTPLLVARRPPRAAWVTGTSVAAVVTVVFLGNGSTSRFLLLWNVGLPGYFPGVAYALAAGALALTLLGLWRDNRRLEAAGLALLITGGIGLHSTYQSGLVIAGLATLAIVAPERDPRGSPPPS